MYICKCLTSALAGFGVVLDSMGPASGAVRIRGTFPSIYRTKLLPYIFRTSKVGLNLTAYVSRFHCIL